MKAATGELNLTLITVIAIGAILAIFYALLPKIQEKIEGNFNEQNETKTDYNIGLVTEDYEFTNYIRTDLF